MAQQREWTHETHGEEWILRDVSDRPDAHPAPGNVLVEDLKIAPWGEWSLGFSEVTEEWLAENATPRQ